MTKGENFGNVQVPHIVDTEYVECNFAWAAPVDTAGVKTGHRLFPGDDTPRTFTRCMMNNVEPPPTATLTKCKTNLRTMRERDPSLDETVTIDGQGLTLEKFITTRWGRYNPATKSYEYLATSEVEELDG